MCPGFPGVRLPECSSISHHREDYLPRSCQLADSDGGFSRWGDPCQRCDIASILDYVSLWPDPTWGRFAAGRAWSLAAVVAGSACTAERTAGPSTYSQATTSPNPGNRSWTAARRCRLPALLTHQRRWRVRGNPATEGTGAPGHRRRRRAGRALERLRAAAPSTAARRASRTVGHSEAGSRLFSVYWWLLPAVRRPRRPLGPVLDGLDEPSFQREGLSRP